MEESVKILHVIDDEKFISYCNLTFEADNIRNTFTKSENFKSSAKTEHFHFIVIHYLSCVSAEVLNNNNFNIPIIWFFWGGDGFLLGKFSNTFLLPKTKLLLLNLTFKKGIGLGIRKLFKFVIPEFSDRLYNNRQLINSFDKISLVVPVMPGDYHLLKEKYKLKPQMFHLNYVNPALKESETKFTSGENILLGNSASYSNNHLEILETLSKIELGKRQVIIPLSYGDKKYGEYITNHAKLKLGENALCLLEFIPMEQYFKLLESCTIVIMNHLRQQAVGNIVPMLAKGSHVYLHQRSSLYKFLKEKDFLISTIDEVKDIRELTNEERRTNKRLCLSYFGKETQHLKLRRLLKNISLKLYES